MGRYLQVSILLCCLFYVTGVAHADSADFRNLYWGMTIHDVKAQEPVEPLIATQDVLIYPIELAQLQAYITYHFGEEGLAGSVIDFRSEHANPDAHIADFYYLRDLISKKYGRPLSFVDYEWKNGCITDAMELAHFIFLGKLSYAQTWRVGRTVIHLTLTLDEEAKRLALQLSLTAMQHWDQQWAKNPLATHPWVRNQPWIRIKQPRVRDVQTEAADLAQI